MSLFVVIGWIGAITFIVAYFLISIKILSADSITYHLLNALGGFSLVINSIHFNDSSNFFVNLIWMGIALYSVMRIVRVKKIKVLK